MLRQPFLLVGRNRKPQPPTELAMSHQDQSSHTPCTPHHQALKRALDWLLLPAVLSNITFRNDCTWTPRSLIFTALLWVWSDETALTDRFFTARKIVVWMLGLTQKPATTYQAFLKLLKTWTVALALALVTAFRQRMRADLEKRFLVGGFPVFGVDGSRLELPRTEANEQRFSPASAWRQRPKPRRQSTRQARARTKAARAAGARQKKTNSPQMWLTMMWHVGTGLPWDWRLGPSDSSERAHLKQMIAALPAGALVTADAGFVGYEYWKALRDSGRHLLI